MGGTMGGMGGVSGIGMGGMGSMSGIGMGGMRGMGRGYEWYGRYGEGV